MAQRLIVEGNDAIALTNICIKRGIKPPKGYQNSHKYKTEFVKRAGSIDLVKIALKEELQSPDVTRIGIIVDANNIGVEARYNSLKDTIESTLQIEISEKTSISAEGFGHQILENLFIGIWVMPNNISKGYLEHFLSTLIPTESEVWRFANQKIEELVNQDFCEFTAAKKQKALLHTYLAWKKDPGLPMGTAIKAGYIDSLSSFADNFANWFETTFELEQ